jgi:hypothetical protein
VTAEWADVRQRVLTRVFYAHPPDDVAASTDLVRDGYLDSMSVLVVLGMFDDELGAGVALRQARIPDTASLAAMESFYERLRASG